MERYPRPVCYRANQSPAPTDTELGFQRILGDLIGTRFQQFPPTPSRPTDRVVKTSSASNNVRNRLREQSASVITSVSGPIVFDLYIILLPFERESTMMDRPTLLTRRYAFLPSPSWKVTEESCDDRGNIPSSFRGWSRLK